MTGQIPGFSMYPEKLELFRSAFGGAAETLGFTPA
jgi:hypothetical protein